MLNRIAFVDVLEQAPAFVIEYLIPCAQVRSPRVECKSRFLFTRSGHENDEHPI